jgi:hypothetical protein
MITLDVRISCDTFWDYQFNIPIRINDYYNPNQRNTININHVDHRSNTCDVGNVGRSDPAFLRLEEHLVEYAIQHIYDDLVRKRQQKDITILLNIRRSTISWK